MSTRNKVYQVPPASNGDYWTAVSDVPCPVPGCGQTVVWYEAGYVPGYRVCMARSAAGDGYAHDTLRHRFTAGGDAAHPTLTRVG